MKSIKIEGSWKNVLSNFFDTEEFNKLREKVREEYIEKNIYPKPDEIFNAFNLCPIDKVKVVILGQDPYHGKGQAHGLSFSVKEGVKLPPSLQNIFKEIKDDVGKEVESGDLTKWAEQGVFLLNSILTVQAGNAASHKDIGWEKFTDEVIKTLSKERENLVFILWGNYAKNKAEFIDKEKHLILTAAHPSPLSANNGFFGCRHFSKANEYLKKHKKGKIDW